MPRLSAAEVVRAQRAHQHAATVRAMHQVADETAARLHRLARELRQAPDQKQDPPALAGTEGSTRRSESTGSEGRCAPVCTTVHP